MSEGAVVAVGLSPLLIDHKNNDQLAVLLRIAAHIARAGDDAVFIRLTRSRVLELGGRSRLASVEATLDELQKRGLVNWKMAKWRTVGHAQTSGDLWQIALTDVGREVAEVREA